MLLLASGNHGTRPLDLPSTLNAINSPTTSTRTTLHAASSDEALGPLEKWTRLAGPLIVCHEHRSVLLRISFPLDVPGELNMLNLLKALRQDENGVILSAEIVIIGSLLVVGLITGLTCLQQSVNGELKDLAGALGSLDQSYAYSAHRKQGFGDQCCAWTAGSSYSNCEKKADNCTDIIGCTDICYGGSAGCCKDQNCAGRPEGSASCGTCGGRQGGCGTCGGYGRVSGGFSVDGYQPPQKARCIESGVQKLRVSEWPLDCPTSEVIVPQTVVPHTVIETPVLAVPFQDQTIHQHPAIEMPHGHVQPHGYIHEGTIIERPATIEHVAPIESIPAQPHAPVQPQQAPPAQPVPSNDPLPMPTSEQPKVLTYSST